MELLAWVSQLTKRNFTSVAVQIEPLNWMELVVTRSESGNTPCSSPEFDLHCSYANRQASPSQRQTFLAVRQGEHPVQQKRLL